MLSTICYKIGELKMRFWKQTTTCLHLFSEAVFSIWARVFGLVLS